MVVILIPVFNEEKNIGKLLNDIHTIFIKLSLEYKILVVDDGSDDNSVRIIKGLQDKISIDLLQFKRNSGIGQVMRAGLSCACSMTKDEDTIVFLEGDGSIDTSVLPEMLDRIEKGREIVIASRYCKGGEIEGFPLKRRFLSTGLNLLLKLSFPSGITDYSIFFRAYKAGLLKRGFDEYGDDFIKSKGFSANTEILLKLMAFKPKTDEVPLSFKYYLKSSRSRLKIWKEILGHLLLISKQIPKNIR